MKYLLLVISLFSVTTAFSQGKLSKKLRLKSKFITFEKTRLSIGLNGSLGLVQKSSEAPSFSSQTDIPTGVMVSTGLLLDIYSPLSATGFTTGVNLNDIEFKYKEKINDEEITIDSFNLEIFEIPFSLRFKTGHVGARTRLVFMPGISYNIPREAKLESLNQQPFEDKEILKSFFQYKLQVGLEIMLGKKSVNQVTGQYEAEARTRLFIYAGVNYTRGSYYNSDFNQIPGYFDNQVKGLADIEFSNYNLGASIYYALSDSDNAVSKAIDY